MLIIKQLRRKKNVSQTNLANAIGVSLRTIQLYEKKDANIPIKNLTRIAQYFDMSIGQLYSQEVNESDGVYDKQIVTSKKGHSITKLAPGKYLLSAPLITKKEEKRYSNNHDSLIFLDKLVKVGFVVEQVSVARYIAFEISNDTMDNGKLNGLPEGTIVLGKQVSKKDFKTKVGETESQTWILVYKTGVMCKEIIDYNRKEGTITCHGLNGSPEYPDFEIAFDQVRQFFTILKRQVD
jgi:transcriptional regulator with XRE-family HTH domain